MQLMISNIVSNIKSNWLKLIRSKFEEFKLKLDPEKLESLKNPFEQSILFILIFALAFGHVEAKTAESSIDLRTKQDLRSKYDALAGQLKNNPFNREITINSSETSSNLRGEIYAVVNYPFSTVNAGLNSAGHWCDVLILHVNIKYCYAQPAKSTTAPSNTILTVDLGKKYEQPLDDTYRVDFNYRQVAAQPDYFAIALNAKDGPLGTYDYQILVEATPLDKQRSFLHFTYTYSFGLKGRVAMKTYLVTTGREKVGFTKVREDNSYIQGVRGVIERNTMRYYLAIDAYLSASNQEKRFANWYDSTDQYSRQLKEVEREDYLAMKRKEYQRQQTQQ